MLRGDILWPNEISSFLRLLVRSIIRAPSGVHISRYTIICRITLATGVILVALQGCKVGPDYSTPQVIMPDRWHQKAVRGLHNGEANLQTWWRYLEDPVLNDLIERSWQGNFDVKQAHSRILQSQSLRGIAAGERFPDCTVSTISGTA